MSDFDSWLKRQAYDVRHEVQPAWDAETICPGYTWDENNRALGQCGITRDAFGERIMLLSTITNLMLAAMTKGATGTLRDGTTVDLTSELRGIDDTYFQITGEYSELLQRQELMREYGYAKEQSTGRVLKDHCWMRMGGTIIELTLDQFNAQGLEFPKILVQPANARDTLVTYHPETSELFGTHDTSARQTEERLTRLMNNKKRLVDIIGTGELSGEYRNMVTFTEEYQRTFEPAYNRYSIDKVASLMRAIGAE